MVEFELPSLDKEKNEKQYSPFEESVRADDIEKKKIFQQTTGKKYKISFDELDLTFPTKINISKQTVEFTNPDLATVSCGCQDFILDELQFLEKFQLAQWVQRKILQMAWRFWQVKRLDILPDRPCILMVECSCNA
jgi:hypothetical protein